MKLCFGAYRGGSNWPFRESLTFLLSTPCSYVAQRRSTTLAPFITTKYRDITYSYDLYNHKGCQAIPDEYVLGYSGIA